MGSSFSSTRRSSTLNNSECHHRKRRRSETSEGDRTCVDGCGDENESNASGENECKGGSDDEKPPSRKRRRREIPALSSLTTTSFASYALDMMVERVGSFFAKVVLLGLEMTVRHSTKKEVVENVDLFQLLLQMLENFQSIDDDILRRGWRVIYACTCYDDDNGDEKIEGAEATASGQRSREPQRHQIYLDNTAAKIGEVPTIVMVMMRRPKSIRVQLLGFRALRKLTNREENWKALWKSGGIGVFLETLVNFPDDLVMQGLALTFLALLVREEGEVPRYKILRGGGVPLILAAMRRFEDDPHLLHTGCYALHQLGFARSAKSLIVEHGGIPILLRAVERHVSEVWLVDLCLSALSKLSDEQTIQMDSIPLVLMSMERYPEEQAVQGHGLVLFLRAIGRDPAASEALITSAIRAILTAMKNFPDSSSIQFFGCAALREILLRLGRGREAVRLMSSLGGIECVLDAVEKHRDIFGLQPMALLFLMNVWEQRNNNEQDAVTAFGGNDNVVALVAGLFMDPEQAGGMD